MTSFWNRLFSREPVSDDGTPRKSPNKRNIGHYRSLSQFFSSSTRKSSDHETCPDSLSNPTSHYQHRSILTCQERIHYPLYDPNDPRHNPEVRSRLRGNVPRISLDQEATPRIRKASHTDSSKKSSPSKSLRRAGSSLRAFADSIRFKTTFNRREIPSFSECAPSGRGLGKRELGNSRLGPENEISVHHSRPMDIPTNSLLPNTANGIPAPKYFSPDTLEKSDEAMSLYGTKPSALKNRLLDTPHISRLFDRQARRTSPSRERSDVGVEKTHLTRSTEIKANSGEHSFSDDDIFGPLCDDKRHCRNANGIEPPSANHSIPTTTYGLGRIPSPARTPPSKNIETTMFLESLSFDTISVDFDGKHSSCIASISPASRQTAFRLPSSNYGASAANSDSGVASEPGMPMGKRKPCVSRRSIQTSECNTERDSSFGADLCRISCQRDKDDSALRDNLLLLPWLASMGIFEKTETELLDTSSMPDYPGFSRNTGSLNSYPRYSQCNLKFTDDKYSDGKGLAIDNGADSDSLRSDEAHNAPTPAQNTFALNTPSGENKPMRKNCRRENGLLQVARGGNSDIGILKTELECKFNERQHYRFKELPSCLRYMIEAIDRMSGCEMEQSLSEKENLRIPSEFFPIGLSESLREEQLRLKRDPSGQVEILQEQYSSSLPAKLCAENPGPRKTGRRAVIPLSVSTTMRPGISSSDKSDQSLFPTADSSSGMGESNQFLRRKDDSSTDSNDSSQSEPTSGTTYATTFSSSSSARNFESEKQVQDVLLPLKTSMDECCLKVVNGNT
ncbi:hypothetical protein PRK78_005285 [Emydomyces testavorans]|uniref:Uncharacterized protein n=1 Tax=Emydomyces testavorans TaxID=2070801 RepID=A0AAF0DJD3_9EURO|nr:hypothetical protein PRK78_005285 [Emydomyces testavorans]